MDRRDREMMLWAAETTLAGLGELGARWAEGRLAYRPDYDRPDEETTRITQELASVNRAGFITIGSQPGTTSRYECALAKRGRPYLREIAKASAPVMQRAAVDGLVSDGMAVQLRHLAEREGFLIVDHAPPHPVTASEESYASAIPVTWYDGEPVTWIGAELSHADLEQVFQGCNARALAEVCNARQVALVQRQPGLNTLWPALMRLTAVS